MAPEHAQQPQYHAGSGQDRKPDRNTANADSNRILPVDVESLRRPEHEDGKEVGTRDSGDDESQGKSSWGLLETTRKHGKLGKFDFPDNEKDQQHDPDDKWRKNVGLGPRVLRGN